MQDLPTIVQKDAESGKIALRNAVVLACFVHRPVHEICEHVAAMLDEYLSCIPADALTWAIPNASAEQWKPIDQKTLPGIKKLLDPQGAKARDLTSFRLADSAGEAPAFEFRFAGKPKSYKSPPAGSLVQMVFPIETAREAYVDGLVDRVKRLSAMIDFSYGYCSPALLYRELRLVYAYPDLRGLAMRHAGYDVQNNLQAAWGMGVRARGARWITMLGTQLQAELGGAAKLERAFGGTIGVEPLGTALMIRAGRVPEIGDTNRREDTPLLRTLAKVLEPVTAFDEKDLVFGRFEDDDVLLQRWERRFLD
jgi:hypothetical protein